MRRATPTALALLGLLAAPRPADATCEKPDETTPLASVDLGGSGLSEAGPHPILQMTIVASGNQVQVRDTETLWPTSLQTLGGSVQNTPNPVQLDDGSYAVFVARQDGVVSKIDPESGTTEWSKSLRRASCPDDSLSATPSVHLRRFATASFKAAYSTDVVYVATRYSSACAGSTTDNRIYALRATDGHTLWTFNGAGSVDMDIVSEAGYLDAANDMLYVASERTSPTQDSVWAIDVLTGTASWSVSAGKLQTTPVVRGDRIYLGTMFGEIKALDKDDGALLWTVSGGLPITTNIFPEFRNPYRDLIGAVDAMGRVWLVRDDGRTGASVWTASLPKGAAATSRVAFDPEAGKLYVGADDGALYQLNIVDGSVEASRTVDTGATVGDASFVFEEVDGTSDVRMIAGTSSGVLAKFCTPWSATEVAAPSTLAAPAPAGPPDPGVCSDASDCGGGSPSACSTWDCVQGVCVATPDADDSSCNDGNAFTSGDTCYSGVCAGISECQGKLDACKCMDASGQTVARKLLTVESPKEDGSTNETAGNGYEVSEVRATNHCLTIGTRARSAVYVHLLDQNRRPFTGAKVGLTIQAPSNTAAPVWSDAPASQTIQATESNRPGTYFAYLEAPSSGQPSVEGEPVKIVAKIEKGACVSAELETFIEIEAPASDGLGGCDLLSDVGNTGALRVTVLDGGTSPPKPLEGAQVMVGYAEDPFAFYSDFESFIASDAAVGDRSNVLTTDDAGQVHFLDYGDKLNGPYIVTAGYAGKEVEYAHVTIDDLASSDVTLVLPLASNANASSAWYEEGKVSGINNDDGLYPGTPMGLVAERRDLGFYTGLDPADLFEGAVCTAAGGLAPENAYIDDESPWAKNLALQEETLQISMTSVPASVLDATSKAEMVAAWLRNAAYVQIGFLDLLVSGDVQGAVIALGGDSPAGELDVQVQGAPPWADVLGMQLADYSSDVATGRGAGDVFLQTHGHMALQKGETQGSVAALYFPQPTAGKSDAPADAWNLVQAEALYSMHPPCDSTKPDPRCADLEIAKTSMRTGRTSRIVRVDGSSCSEPLETTTSFDLPPFLRLLDLVYDPKSGTYDVCAGGVRDTHGACCAGGLGGASEDQMLEPACDTKVGPQRGDFIQHTISVVESYHPELACGAGSLVSSSPRWVFYTPGVSARIAPPDLPSSFGYACGGASTPACKPNQRPGLPPRSGSGAPCKGDGDCPKAEVCAALEPDAAPVCATKEPSGALVVERYEWKAELFELGLIGSSCQHETPCDPDELPAPDGSFTGRFDFEETLHCVTGQSTNAVMVDEGQE